MDDFIGPGGGCLVGWILFGLCGFVGRRIVVIGPIVAPPEPEPGPDWLVAAVVAVLAGIAAGYYFHAVFSIDHADSAGILLTFVGAFVAGRVAADVVPRLTAQQRTST